MHKQGKTVKIIAKNKTGFILINESDFDVSQHKRFFDNTKQTKHRKRKSAASKARIR